MRDDSGCAGSEISHLRQELPDFDGIIKAMFSEEDEDSDGE
jgi:hypothetical protein